MSRGAETKRESPREISFPRGFGKRNETIGESRVSWFRLSLPVFWVGTQNQAESASAFGPR
jgi:hypothetical protein